MAKKLTKEQVESLPEKLKTLTVDELAKEWGMSKQAIRYWVTQYRKRGVYVETIKKMSMLDKIDLEVIE